MRTAGGMDVLKLIDLADQQENDKADGEGKRK